MTNISHTQVAGHDIRLVKMAARTYQIWEGDLQWGEVLAAKPGRWSWLDRNGKPHHSHYPNRHQALFDMVTTQAAYPHLFKPT